jgi:hypothetical protein
LKAGKIKLGMEFSEKSAPIPSQISEAIYFRLKTNGSFQLISSK